MKKQINLIIGIVVFLVAIVLVGVLYNNLKPEYTPDPIEQGKKPHTADQNDSSASDYAAPDFTVYDEYGNAVQLSDYFGKPIVLNFWASWCTYCIQEMPHFNNAYYKYPDVQFLMVNVTDGTDETLASAQSFINGSNFDFPVLYDTSLDATNKYQAYALPMTIFIDENGELVTYFSGMLTADNLERGIAEIR
jgi:thiol-disulfide isomerase/thioredoxin